MLDSSYTGKRKASGEKDDTVTKKPRLEEGTYLLIVIKLSP